MKKLLYPLICVIVTVLIISCVNSCNEYDDIINHLTKYEVSYTDSVDKDADYFTSLEPMDPYYVSKKIKKLKEGKIHKCFIERTEEGKILHLRNDEIVCKMYFKIYEDGAIHYKNYTIEHFYEYRNYNIIPKGMKLHSMYGDNYAVEFIGELMFKTYHNDKTMYVSIPFHIRCYFNLKEDTTKFVLEI